MRLHHVGVLVKSIPEAAGDFARRYGYELKSDVIHDPVQTAYVQFLRLPGESTYLELVAPDRLDSKLGNALARGGGMHHLCFATAGVADECERLRGEGLFLIQSPIPAV